MRAPRSLQRWIDVALLICLDAKRRGQRPREIRSQSVTSDGIIHMLRVTGRAFLRMRVWIVRTGS